MYTLSAESQKGVKTLCKSLFGDLKPFLLSPGSICNIDALFYILSVVKEKVEFWEEVKNNLWALLILIMQVWKNIS